jgi:hypothetical protein
LREMPMAPKLLTWDIRALYLFCLLKLDGICASLASRLFRYLGRVAEGKVMLGLYLSKHSRFALGWNRMYLNTCSSL